MFDERPEVAARIAAKLPDYTGLRKSGMSHEFNKRINKYRQMAIRDITSYRQGFSAALAYVDSRIREEKMKVLAQNTPMPMPF